MRRLWFCLSLAVVWMASPITAAASDPPPARVPWSTGRVSGSPEPAKLYQLERVYPKIQFDKPVDLAFAPGSDRVFVVEHLAKIYSFRDDPACEKADLFADLPADVRGLDNVPGCTGVQHSFGLTFHPKFQQNHYCYISYLLKPARGTPELANGQRVSRFTVVGADTPGAAPRIDPGSEVVLLDWQGGGHMGSCLKFGADGYLYISAGDANDPAPPDQFHTGQDISDLLSSVLRIDVDHTEGNRPYAIPQDNPFVHLANARPEVWAYGLRNPWKMSFDRAAGGLWAGDVGWELWDMVYRINRAGNYGWSIMEGPHPVYPDARPGPTPIIKPEVSLSHTEGVSITGGFVYRGTRLPELSGHYLFGDFETRRLWAAKVEGEHLAPHRTIAQTEQRIVSFGERADGELVIADYEGGGLYRIVPNPDAGRVTTFPRKLSETGLFASVVAQSPAPGVVPFSVIAEQWNDGATARRFVAVSGSDEVSSIDGHKVFPKNSVLVRTFSLELAPGVTSSRRNVETQLLHFDGRWWNGYSYQWNEAQTDAELVPSNGAEQAWSVADEKAPGGKHVTNWRYASRGQCITCHTAWTDYTLGYAVGQLDRPLGKGAAENQLAMLRRIGLFPSAAAPAKQNKPRPSEGLVDPRDKSADLTARARSYLHANCSHCHRPAGGGAALIDLRAGETDPKLPVVDALPVCGTLGLSDPRVLAPGDPARSVMLMRMSKLGQGRMPHIGSYEVDVDGVRLVADWARQLPATDPSVSKSRQDSAAFLKAASAGGADAEHAIDALLSTTGGALELVLGIDDLPPAVRASAIAKGIVSTQDIVRDLFERFIPPDRRLNRLGPNINAAELLAKAGDATRGRQVFFESAGGLCRNCHPVNGQGESFGPDLSHIGTKYDRAAILDNVLNPSKTVDPQFVSWIVRTRSGDDFTGLLVEKSDREVVLKDANRQLVHIPSGTVSKMTAQPLSAMPEGLLGSLTAQQAADLLEFLAFQK